MSFQSITAAQRLAIRDNASKVATAAQKYVQTFEPITAAEGNEVNPLLVPLANALAAAGASASLPATQAIVSNGSTIPLQNSAGASIDNITLTVAANTVGNAKLPATTAAVKNTAAVTVPVTFVTARTAGQQATVAVTFTVAAGVITAISIA